MYQLIFFIHSSVNLEDFDAGWPLVLESIEKMPGLIEESVSRLDKFLYGQKSITRIYSFLFQDRKILEDSLLSESGEKAGQMIHTLTNGGVTIMTGEYQEDTLDNIQSHSSIL
jgi:hypothetical protein